MPRDKGLQKSADGNRRCWWCGDDPAYMEYHDREWGMPVQNDQRLFEKICLEGFQAGLSWLTILRKREAFREAFAGFDIQHVAGMGARDVTRLVQNASIVRHRGKIESTINNARHALKLVDELGSLARYFWQFEPVGHKRLRSKADIQAVTPESVALSKDLRSRGWSFVGPTTSYAFMQAMGMVNDHIVGCRQWSAVEQARANFKRPS